MAPDQTENSVIDLRETPPVPTPPAPAPEPEDRDGHSVAPVEGADGSPERGAVPGAEAVVESAEEALGSDVTVAGATAPESATPEAVTAADEVAALTFREIPIDDVVPNPRQPRQVFDEEGMAELVHSIQEIGLLQPVVVRPAGATFELVAGERRLRACRLAGFTHIPALIRTTADDAMLRDALLENLHRVQLNPLEEAAAYSQLMADFSCTQEALAQRVGRSRPQVANMLRLLKLPPTVQRRVAAGVLSAGHARAILGADDEQVMEQLAGKVIAEGLSVRAVEELVILGSGQEPRRRGRARGGRETPVEYAAAADRLSDRFETRVRIEHGAKKGRIVIEFAGTDDLARLVELLEPEPAPTA